MDLFFSSFSSSAGASFSLSSSSSTTGATGASTSTEASSITGSSSTVGSFLMVSSIGISTLSLRELLVETVGWDCCDAAVLLKIPANQPDEAAAGFSSGFSTTSKESDRVDTLVVSSSSVGLVTSSFTSSTAGSAGVASSALTTSGSACLEEVEEDLVKEIFDSKEVLDVASTAEAGSSVACSCLLMTRMYFPHCFCGNDLRFLSISTSNLKITPSESVSFSARIA
mmetsp:Transcript_1048/g.1779  ORF Transcript_1048/g.1779 Transcript_1048/m.1779 type:complete len:226 (-) Transcript_1048:199-876(-)